LSENNGQAREVTQVNIYGAYRTDVIERQVKIEDANPGQMIQNDCLLAFGTTNSVPVPKKQGHLTPT